MSESTEITPSGGSNLEAGLIQVLKGEAQFRDVLDLDEVFLQSVEQRAHSLYASGRYHTAETLLAGLVSLDPDRPYPNMLLGDIALRTGRIDRAKYFLATAHEHDPDEPAITLKLGEALLREGLLEDALEVLTYTVEKGEEGGGDDIFTRRARALITQHDQSVGADG